MHLTYYSGIRSSFPVVLLARSSWSLAQILLRLAGPRERSGTSVEKRKEGLRFSTNPLAGAGSLSV